MIDLKGKVAVITGAGSGIGAATAKRLHELNANVVLIARSEQNIKKLAEELSSQSKTNKANYFTGDVRDELFLKNVRQEVADKFNHIDILVTCAAAAGTTDKAEEMTLEAWKEVLSIDLDGVFLSCKTMGSEMIRNNYGRIINLTSFHNVATYPNRTAYNAAKSGVMGLTRALAVEWGRYGITINAVAPGPIKTPRTSWFLSQSPEVETGMLGRTPNNRLGETEDVSSLIAFLASEQSKHINGQELTVDGGWTKSAWWGSYSEL